MIATSDLPSSTHERTTEKRGKLERTDSPQSIACFPSPPPLRSRKRIDDDLESSHAPTATTELSSLSVRFERSVTVRFTRSHRDYTPRQIKDCFYQAYELKEIKKTCYEDLRRHLMWGDQKELADYENETYCLRGLENFTEKSNKHKHQLRAEAANRVFDALDDGCDEITIAEEYAAVAARSQTWANILGLRDQRDALLIHGKKQ